MAVKVTRKDWREIDHPKADSVFAKDEVLTVTRRTADGDENVAVYAPGTWHSAVVVDA